MREKHRLMVFSFLSDYFRNWNKTEELKTILFRVRVSIKVTSIIDMLVCRFPVHVGAPLSKLSNALPLTL
jgi:hypothetical protein